MLRYGSLLRYGAHSSHGKSLKSADYRSANCYGTLLRDTTRNVFVRGGRFYYRRTLPADVQRLTGRSEVWRSLRTDSAKIAMRRLPMIVAQVEADIETARHQAGLTVDEALLRPFPPDSRPFPRGSDGVDLAPISSDPQRTRSSLTLRDAYQRYLDDPTHAWTPSTQQAYATTRAVVIAAIGAHKAIADLSRLDVRELVEVLRFLPRNLAKLFPRLTLREAALRARSDDTITRISTANANAYLGNFSTFLNWAVGEEIIHRNPARGLRLPDEGARRDKRHPFSPKQLSLIFHAPLYTGCGDGERGWDVQGTERPIEDVRGNQNECRGGSASMLTLRRKGCWADSPSACLMVVERRAGGPDEQGIWARVGAPTQITERPDVGRR